MRAESVDGAVRCRPSSNRYFETNVVKWVAKYGAGVLPFFLPFVWKRVARPL